MKARLSTFWFRLGFALQALRRPKPSAADISSVRVALVLAIGSGDAMVEAVRTARRDAREAGVVDPDLDATLAGLVGVARTIHDEGERQAQRLGIR